MNYSTCKDGGSKFIVDGSKYYWLDLSITSKQNGKSGLLYYSNKDRKKLGLVPDPEASDVKKRLAAMQQRFHKCPTCGHQY